ncbi:MAG: hypothetical protein IJX47_07050 [Clostridia bacterium]|nr:hypothetical protein [Clostridia bacterium]
MRKPFLGTDITYDKDNDNFNGDCFIVANASELHSAALNAATSNAAQMIEKTEKPFPLPLRILEWVSLIAGVSVISGILKALSGDDAVTLAQGYQNAPALFWIGGISILLWLGLFLYKKSKIKQLEATGKPDEVNAKLDSVAESIFFELGVPEDAAKVDILSFTYKEKNGEAVPKAGSLDTTPYHNFEMRVFVESDTLFLTDVESKYAIPLASLTAIRTVNKRISVPLWNKDIGYNEGIYKSYKLTANNMDDVFLKPYHILEFTHEGELWGIWFPCYELPVMEALTGLKAE